MMVEFFILSGFVLAAALAHSAYEAGLEEGERRTMHRLRQQTFEAMRAEFERPEAGRQELSGSYRIVRRLVTNLGGEA